MTTHGTMATDRPGRYAKGDTRTLVMAGGHTVVLRPVEGALRIEVVRA